MEQVIKLLLWYLHPHSDLFHGSPTFKKVEYTRIHKATLNLIHTYVTEIGNGTASFISPTWDKIIGNIRELDELDGSQ